MKYRVLSRGAVHALFACVVTCGAVNVSSAETIDSGPRTRDIFWFGEPGTEMYGQTFTVGADNVLTSFSFDLANAAGPSTDFTFHILAWDGDSATGSVLFQTGVHSITNTSYQTYTFATGSLALTTGQTYVAFTNTVLNGSGDQAQMGGTGNTYLGGEFVYLHGQGNTMAAATTNTWTQNHGIVDGDTRFTATFEAPSAVPLPAAAWAGIALFGVIGGAKLRRRKAEAV